MSATRYAPGAMIQTHGPRFTARQGGPQPPPEGEIPVSDARSGKERYVPWGLRCLVIAVHVYNQRDPTFSTWVTCFDPEYGFFRVETTRTRIIWSPVDESPGT